jgi:hypothetical protein
MMKSSGFGLGLLVLAGTGLGAQSLPEALQTLPAETAYVDIYRNLAVTEQRWEQAQGRLQVPRSSLEPFLATIPAGLVDGPVLVGHFAGKGAEAGVFVVHAEPFNRLVKGLGAVKAGPYWKVGRKGGGYFVAHQGAYALLCTDSTRLKAWLDAPLKLGAELAPLAPWIAGHDLVKLAPAMATQAGISGLEAAAKGKSRPGLPVQEYLQPLLAKAEQSVTQVALAMDFAEDGSAVVRARAFFRPGTVPATALAASAGSVHPLDGLLPSALVFGGGGPIPRNLAEWSVTFMGKLLASGPAGADPELLAKAAASRAELARQLRSEAFGLALPLQKGDPLCSGLTVLFRVEDGDRYLQLLEANTGTQSALLKAQGGQFRCERGEVLGAPSLMMHYNLGGGSGKPGEAAGRMALAVLFGSTDQINWSVGRVDEHTLLGTLGGAKQLQTALEAYRPGFGQDPGVAASDALLPAPAPWRFYFNLQSARDLMQLARDQFDPDSAKPLPLVPAAPPLGVAFSLDVDGAELRAAAPRDTLQALGAFIQAVAGMVPGKPAAHPKSK